MANLSDRIGAAAAGGLELIETINITSAVTSVEFTNFDSTKYNAYLFVVQNIVFSDDDNAFSAETSGDGGITYDGTSGDYAYASTTHFSTTTDTGSGASVSNISIVPYGAIDATIGNAANEDLSCTMWMIAPHLSSFTRMTWEGMFSNKNGDPVFFSGGGVRKEAAEVDGISFTPLTETIDAGAISIYGVRNS